MFNLNKGEKLDVVDVIVPNDPSDLEKEIEEVEGQLEFAKSMIPEWEKKLEIFKREYEEKRWMKTEHPKEFGGLYISSNCGEWEDIDKSSNENPFYIHVTKEHGSGSLSIKDAKELIKYLQQKIDYLEEK